MAVLLSSEVREEIQELHLMLRLASPTERIVLNAPEPILAELPDELLADPALDVVPVTAFDFRSKVVSKTRSLVQFIALTRRVRPRLIVSGFSMLKHRLASQLFDIPHIAYVRGLVFDPGAVIGISDRVRFGLLRGRDSRLFNAYDATHVLTVAQLNADFIQARGVDPGKVSLVGPIWLRRESDEPKGHPPRVFVVTQAFATHGQDAAQERQVTAVSELASALGRMDENLHVRVHPRDFQDYEAVVGADAIVIDRTPPAEFLTSLTPDDLLVSPLSTMAFEAAYLGVPVLFYQLDPSDERSTAAFERLGITPKSVANVAQAVAAGDRPIAPSVFAPVDIERIVEVLEPDSHTSAGQASVPPWRANAEEK